MKNRSTAEGPANIVKDGLRFNIDPANERSYYGSNTQLRDITKNSWDMTLSNSPTYTTDYKGSMTFSRAANQSFTLSPIFLTTESFAVDVWLTPTPQAGTSWPGIISTGDLASTISNTSVGWGLGWFGGSSGYLNRCTYGAVVTGSSIPATLIRAEVANVLSDGQLVNLIFTRNTIDARFELYVNGKLGGTIACSNNYSVSSSSLIRPWIWQYTKPANGTYHSIKMYTGTNFGAEEVSQNYNALKYRFGL
tara:strand:+ start:106 stop:855 length:750 start_codon:yes stop_codon:yes gene_type:complete